MHNTGEVWDGSTRKLLLQWVSLLAFMILSNAAQSQPKASAPDINPNIKLVQQIGLAIQEGDISRASNVLAEDVVWHYFNPRLPDLTKDYKGLNEVRTFFQILARRTEGSFRLTPVSANAIGNELVISHARINLTLEGRAIDTDVLVVWRIIAGRVVEVWDIPAVGLGPSGR
jgi:ketosteroid isomerase-like protein